MAINSLDDFGKQISAMLSKNPEWPKIKELGSQMLSEFVLNPSWFQPILSDLILDEAFLKSQWLSIDPNDIQIYRDPDKAFSIRAFIWEADVKYPIHDHGAWGIVGAHINRVREIKYGRNDDGKDVNYAELKPLSNAILSPGEITTVLPINEGIHQMGAVDGLTAVTIHIYGAPIRKGYIHYFDPHNHTAHRMYPPSMTKKILAIRTLGSISQAWSEEVLNKAAQTPGPDFFRQECLLSLQKLKG